MNSIPSCQLIIQLEPVTMIPTRDGVLMDKRLWNLVTMVAFRIPRLTLFSGPNCSLCDVRRYFFQFKSINLRKYGRLRRQNSPKSVDRYVVHFKCHQSLSENLLGTYRELSSWISSISRTKDRKSGKRNMSTGYLLSISRARRLPKVVGTNKRSTRL